MDDDKKNLIAICRSDFGAYIEKSFNILNPHKKLIPGRHIDGMAWHLSQCITGKIKRLIITVPPRHLKSHCASIAFPTFVTGHNPGRKIITVSYAEELAHSFSRARRKLTTSPFYNLMFPKAKIDPKKCTESLIEMREGGSCLATTVRGGVTGFGASLVIIDDPIKAADAMSDSERDYVNRWFRDTLYTRLDNKNDDVIIIVMQRVHDDDLVGHVLELDDWTHLCLPAIAEEYSEIQYTEHYTHERLVGDVLHPETETYETLMRIKRIMGSRNFAAQYQQSPLPENGNMVKAEWFKRYADCLALDWFDEVFQSWDTAVETGDENSYSVCLTFGRKGPDFYLLDVNRGHYPYYTLRRLVLEEAQVWGSNRVLIERAPSGISLLQDLSRERGLNLVGITPDLDKKARFSRITGVIEAGHLILPEEAPWLAEFEREIIRFPSVKHSDQADALAHALWHARQLDEQLKGCRVTLIGGPRTVMFGG